MIQGQTCTFENALTHFTAFSKVILQNGPIVRVNSRKVTIGINEEVPKMRGSTVKGNKELPKKGKRLIVPKTY